MTDTKHSAELATCDFCRAEAPVRRKYLYRENKEREIGDGFTITRYCQECGLKGQPDTKHTPKDTNSPDSISTAKDVYQHTDSVEVSHLTDIAIEVWNQNCDKSAPEAMRAVVTALQAHTSQQVENWHKESFDRGLELGQQQVEEAVRNCTCGAVRDTIS